MTRLNSSKTRLRCKHLASCLVGLGLLACAGGPLVKNTLDQKWQWDGGVEASQLMTALKGKKSLPNVAAAVGVTGGGLIGRTLPDGKLWEFEGEVDVLPTLIGDVVLFSGEGRVTMLDLRTGEVRFSIDSNRRRLEGAGFDGEKAALLLVDKDNAREDQIRVVDRAGQGRLSISGLARLGRPAIVDGIGLLPYNSQYVAGFDLKKGRLIGRLLYRDGVHSLEATSDGLLMFGAGASLLSEEITSSPDSRSLKLQPRKLPGEPVWPIDGSKPRPARATPVGLYAKPHSREGTLAFTGDTYVSTYFNLVVGFEHQSNDVLWVTHFDRAVSGGVAGLAGPTLCLDNGDVIRLSLRNGKKQAFGSLGAKVKACVVSSDDSSIPRGKRPSLFRQIVTTISETGPDMLSMQKILLKELGRNSSIETTRALISIARNPLVSTELATDAGRLLPKQEKGGLVMIEALIDGAPQPLDEIEPPSKSPQDTGKNADAGNPDKPVSGAAEGENDTWVENDGEEKEEEENGMTTESGTSLLLDTTMKKRTLRAPPVAAIANALRKLKTPGAAAALAPYLEDPALSPVQLLAVMRAISELGGPENIPEVQAFLKSYKNTGGEKNLIRALVLAASFLFKHQEDEEERLKLRKQLDQSLTHPDLKKKSQGLEKYAPKKTKDSDSAKPASKKQSP